MLSQVLLKKEGSLETAAKVLQRVMLATHGHLSKVANGEEFFPRFHLQDPVLSADAGAAELDGDGGRCRRPASGASHSCAGLRRQRLRRGHHAIFLSGLGENFYPAHAYHHDHCVTILGSRQRLPVRCSGCPAYR